MGREKRRGEGDSKPRASGCPTNSFSKALRHQPLCLPIEWAGRNVGGRLKSDHGRVSARRDVGEFCGMLSRDWRWRNLRWRFRGMGRAAVVGDDGSLFHLGPKGLGRKDPGEGRFHETNSLHSVARLAPQASGV